LKYSTRKVLRDYGATVVVAVSLALTIRTFIVEAYRIPTSAMKPTLLSGDTIFVAKWPFWIQKGHLPKRGEIIIFSGTDSTGVNSLDYIRRVIGLPGDQVALQKGALILNGKKLEDSAGSTQSCFKEKLPEGKQYSICRDAPLMEDFGPEKVPEASVFVLGDSRSSPEDKKKRKSYGMVPVSSLKGQVLWLWLSITPPLDSEAPSSWIPRFRLERMFQRIE